MQSTVQLLLTRAHAQLECAHRLFDALAVFVLAFGHICHAQKYFAPPLKKMGLKHSWLKGGYRWIEAMFQRPFLSQSTSPISLEAGPIPLCNTLRLPWRVLFAWSAASVFLCFAVLRCGARLPRLVSASLVFVLFLVWAGRIRAESRPHRTTPSWWPVC